jgi:hypothetical protein
MRKTKMKKSSGNKNPAAVALGRLGGLRSAAVRSAEARQASARVAARARWGMKRDKLKT